MKRINIFGEVLEAECIVSTEDSVTGTIQGREVFRFSGIRDVAEVELLDGAEWDEPALSAEEQLRESKREIDLLKKRLDSSEDGLLSMMDITIMGGM